MSGSQQKISQQQLVFRHKEVCLIFSLKTVFKNLNQEKSYDKTNPSAFVFSLWITMQAGLNFFWPV